MKSNILELYLEGLIRLAIRYLCWSSADNNKFLCGRNRGHKIDCMRYSLPSNSPMVLKHNNFSFSVLQKKVMNRLLLNKPNIGLVYEGTGVSPIASIFFKSFPLSQKSLHALPIFVCQTKCFITLSQSYAQLHVSELCLFDSVPYLPFVIIFICNFLHAK